MRPDELTDAQLAQKIAVLDVTLSEDNPERTEAYLASPEGRSHGPVFARNVRYVIAEVTDWRTGCRAAYVGELARRREAAKSHSCEKAPAGLYFGPWRGF